MAATSSEKKNSRVPMDQESWMWVMSLVLVIFMLTPVAIASRSQDSHRTYVTCGSVVSISHEAIGFDDGERYPLPTSVSEMLQQQLRDTRPRGTYRLEYDSKGELVSIMPAYCHEDSASRPQCPS